MVSYRQCPFAFEYPIEIPCEFVTSHVAYVDDREGIALLRSLFLDRIPSWAAMLFLFVGQIVRFLILLGLLLVCEIVGCLVFSLPCLVVLLTELVLLHLRGIASLFRACRRLRLSACEFVSFRHP